MTMTVVNDVVLHKALQLRMSVRIAVDDTSDLS